MMQPDKESFLRVTPGGVYAPVSTVDCAKEAANWGVAEPPAPAANFGGEAARPRIGSTGLNGDDCGEAHDNVKIAASRALKILMKKEISGSCTVSPESVYGVAVAMPQIARSAGWSKTYTSLAIRSFVHLFLNGIVQLVLLYQVALESNVMNAYGGQMHLCNFGQYFDKCPGKKDCTGPGGTTYVKDGLYANFQQWNTRMWVRDTLTWLLPNQRDEIQTKVVPGEYGIESPLCRVLCVFLFIMAVVDDFAETLNTILLLWHVPSHPTSWLSYEPPAWTNDKEIGQEVAKAFNLPQGDLVDKNTAKRIMDVGEIDFVKVRVGGMPMRWKVVNLFFVVLPKLIIWLILILAGTQFLMETAAIQDLIINSLAMCFILQIDELIASRLCTEATKAMMQKIEAFDLYSIEEDEAAHDEEVVRDFEAREVKFGLTEMETLVLLFPKRLFFIMSITAVCYFGYYWRFCTATADGSSVSKTLSPPAKIEKIGFWLFRWLWNPDAIERVETPVWRMPGADR